MTHRNGNRVVRERERLDFAKIKTTVQIPNLIDVQKKSYQRFLQMDLLPSEREDAGLQSVFTSVFPIQDFRGLSQLDFVDYAIGNWECKCGHLRGLHHLRATCRNCGASVVTNPYKTGDVLCAKCGTFNKNTPTFCNKCGDPVTLQLKYDVNECQERGMTYSAPLKVTIRLTIYDKDPDTGAKSIRDIKEQEVFFGDIPLMTENGTFIINGTERVIVSQLHRSPGVFYETANNRSYFLGKIIPYRGSWVEFEYDTKNILYVRIDRKRKFLGSIFLRALGMKSNEDILRTFYQVERISLRDGNLYWNVSEGLIDRKLTREIKHPKTGEVLIGAHKRITDPLYKELVKARVTQVEAGGADLEGALTVGELVNRQTGEVLLEANKPLTAEIWATIAEAGINEVDVCFPERDDVGIIVSRTLDKDTIHTPKEALIEIYRKLRPGDPPTLETATALFNGMFFDPRKYDFSKVGRLKFNIKLGIETPLDKRTLDPGDFVGAIKYLLKLRKNIGTVDDIDHLGNRRVRAVGELLENQFRIGLVRMERAIKEKMSVYQEMSTAMPHDLVNAKPVMAAIREFFGSSQLSQFMDQTNPLSEITHKRRLSALGPGGLSRERAGFEVRDVHPTHYGRICPIETPEGTNIGLISHLSIYAGVDDYGFLVTPYRSVLKKKMTSDVRWLRADEESAAHLAPADAPTDGQKIVEDRVIARVGGDFASVPSDAVQYIDISPKQMVGVSAGLIPFLEHDDANRALMGSNMQRQAVPLLVPEPPIVSTGLEKDVATNSGMVVRAEKAGTVTF
ncbi:MAG: DNA-directed RNA polymerase subunit beta, partial [Candidatus Acidiferrales bacterium]